MISALLSLLAGGGGAFLSKSIGDFFDYFKTKQENKHEVEMSKINHEQEVELRKFSLEEIKISKQLDFDQAEMENTFAEAITVQKDAFKSVSKTASFVDKINKLIRPTFCYIFLAFFLFSKATIIYAFFKVGNYDVKTVFTFGKEIWDKDTQTVFFTIVGFIFTARHLTNAEQHVYNKRSLYK